MTTSADATADSATAIRARVLAGECTAVEATEEALRRAEAAEPRVHAFVTLTPERALRRAAELDAARADGAPPGALFGVPIAVKDQYWIAGVRTTGGSRIYAQHVPSQGAVFVDRLERAGAVVIGKTNTPEFGLSWRTFNGVAPETRNPWDPRHTSGGSSGGSAAAVAARVVPLAIGSDCAGSIRLPASFCGILGLMPTPGTVPRTGGFGRSLHFTSVGPLAAHVGDLATALRVMAGPDVTDPGSHVEAPWRTRTTNGMRWRPFAAAGAAIEPAVAAVLDSAYTDIERALGSPVGEVAVLGDQAWSDAFDTMTWADRYTLQGKALLADEWASSQLMPVTAQRFRLGAAVSGFQYVQASEVRLAARAALRTVFAETDLLIGPTVGFTAPFVEGMGDEMPRPEGISAHTYPANFAGLPSATVPAGLANGLPVGLQVVGSPGREDVVLAAAAALESALGETPAVSERI